MFRISRYIQKISDWQNIKFPLFPIC